MEIDARITILFSDEGLRIEIHDDKAVVTFAVIHLDRKQTCQALSRLSHTHCAKAEVFDLDHVGKTREHKTFEFKMPGSEWKDRTETAKKIAVEQCPKGWTPQLYFGSQTSFFYKDDEAWARTNLMRWVESGKGGE